MDAKRYQMSNYIAELQKEKITPLTDLGRELVVLTQYQNGYYQNKEFQVIAGNLVEGLKDTLREVYANKFQFIREPDTLCQKECQPILGELNSQPVQQMPMYSPPARAQTPTLGNNNFRSMAMPVSSNYPQQEMRKVGTVNRLEETKFIGIAPEQQNITY